MSIDMKNETKMNSDDAAPASTDVETLASSEAALAWLESLSMDLARLSELDAASLRRLREAAGRIAFPERS